MFTVTYTRNRIARGLCSLVGVRAEAEHELRTVNCKLELTLLAALSLIYTNIYRLF